MSYNIDAELRPWLAMLPTLDLSDVTTARAEMDALLAQTPPYESPVPLEVEDTTAPGLGSNADVPVRIYRPSSYSKPLAGLLFLHGGGFVVGSIALEDNAARQIAAEVGVVVVSVDYRLAPEHPFPAALEDSYAALTWLAKNGADLGIDSWRVGVGGDSAGGGLSAAVALMARDRGGPALCFQYLGSPELDDRLDTPSMRAFTDTPIWNRPNAELSWQYYLNDRQGDPPPYAAPARTQDLSGLPPAYVSVCEFDPLRDEGLAYASRLVHAGVSTELHMQPGTFHGSGLIEGAAVSRRMHAAKIDGLRRGLSA